MIATVVIKECFPGSFCRRDAIDVRVRSRSHEQEFESIVRLFVQEARALSKLIHPNIVGVHQVFEDNDTAYMAMDLHRGPRPARHHRAKSRERLGPAEIRSCWSSCLARSPSSTTRHAAPGYLARQHPDQPDTANPILIDFGAAREQATSTSSRALSAHARGQGRLLAAGILHLAAARRATASDLYALAATFYHADHRRGAPDSQRRLAAVAEDRKDPFVPLSGRFNQYDRFFLSALDRALEVFPKDRIQSAEDWLTEIDADRRRKMAQSKAQTDEKMQASIQKLVQETNRQVQEAQSREVAPAPKKTVKPSEPKPLFPELMEAPPPERPKPNSTPTSELENDAEEAAKLVSERPLPLTDKKAADAASAAAHIKKAVLEGGTPQRKPLLTRVLSVSLWRHSQNDRQQATIAGKVDP